MLGKPILTIDKFSGSGTGGIFYNEGFSADKENGASLLNQSFITYKEFDNTTTGFDGSVHTGKTPSYIMSIAYLLGLDGSNVYRLCLDNTGKFFLRNFFNTAFHEGYIGETGQTGTDSYVGKPDIYELPSGNLIYTNKLKLGLIVRGKVMTGSSTTSIIDSSGRNLETLAGATLTDMFVVNIKTGAIYPVTSITNGNATKDKLNFTASGSLANTANDEFLLVSPYKFDFATGVTYPAFVGQPDQSYWSRQIKQKADYFYALNGNYISRLSTDETTWAANHKRLPLSFQATCFDTNTDRMLIAARSISHGFRLLLWDGTSDGYSNILKVEDEINCLRSYKNGWVFISNSTLYFTDGYQIQELQSYSGKSMINFSAIAPRNFNGIEIINDCVVTYSTTDSKNRVEPGVFVWNKNYGWSYLPLVYKTRFFGTPSGIFLSNFANSSASYQSNGIDVGLNGGLNVMRDNNIYTSQYLDHSIIYFVKLPRKTQVRQISLNIGSNEIRTADTNGGQDVETTLTVSIGEGRGNLFRVCPTTQILTTTTISMPGTRKTNVGDEIRFIDGPTAGERTFITAIANPGTANEVLTVDPALSGTYNTQQNIQLITLRSLAPKRKIVNISDFNKDIFFQVDKGFISDKLYIEIVVTGSANATPIAINSIDIY